MTDWAPDYEDLRRRLRIAVRRVCPPWLADQAEDLVQVSLLRLVDVVENSETERDFNTSYLYRVAYSTLVDEIRRVQARREVELEAEGEEPGVPSAEPGPSRHAEGKQLGDAIVDCLRRLARPRRAALTLHLHGHGAAEVAELLDLGLKRARNLIYRGLDDLRGCLRRKGMAP